MNNIVGEYNWRVVFYVIAHNTVVVCIKSASVLTIFLTVNNNNEK